MSRLTSAEFKKLYGTSMDNVPEKGVWSGRGIGIPVAGAIGGGDDYKQKIGRGKLPDFRTGSPTQGADSTFSSYLARVNTGYDDYDKAVEYMPMFPEQEEEEGDIYSWDVEPVRSRKLPKDFKIMRPKQKGLKEKMEFNENYIVPRSRYNLNHLFEQPAPEVSDPDLSSVRIKDVVADVLGDALLALADTAGYDVPGALLLVPTVAYNMYQIRSATNKGEELLQAMAANPSDDIAVDMDDVMQDITRDLVDVMQRIIEFLPASVVSVGTANIGSFIAGQAATYAAGTAIRSGSEMYEDLLNKLPDTVRTIIEWTPVSPDPSGVVIGVMKGIISQGLSMVGKLHKAINEYKGARDAPHTPSPDTQEAGPSQDMTKAQAYEMILTGDDVSAGAGLSELKKFIKESIYPDYSTYHEDKPAGYKSRNVPTVVTKQEAESVFDRLDDYDDFSVAYKADGGIVNYQARSLEEQALRNLIQQGLHRVLESKKKN